MSGSRRALTLTHAENFPALARSRLGSPLLSFHPTLIPRMNASLPSPRHFGDSSARCRSPSHFEPRENRLADWAMAAALMGDVGVTFLALLLGFWLRFRSPLAPYGTPDESVTLANYAPHFVLGLALLLGCFAYSGIYRSAALLHFHETAKGIVRGVALWLLIFLALAFFCHLQPEISRLFVVFTASFSLTGLLTWRASFHRLLSAESIATQLRRRVVFIGWTPEAGRLARLVWQDRTDPYEIVGYVDFQPDNAQVGASANVPYLGDFDELAEIVRAEKVDIALLTDVDASDHFILRLATLCETELVEFKTIPSYFPILVSGLHVEMVSGTPVLGVDRLPLGCLHNRILKRVFDLAGALLGITLSLPLIAIFAVIVYAESPGPIFYRQRRLGRRGQHFDLLKIRSMRLDAEPPGEIGWTTKDDARRLRIGAFMRRWNIDELPQFWNVLRGEMSLVGPRPERPELIAEFKHDIAHYNARHLIKPGLTGLAQVNGMRGDTSLSERVRYDLHYMEHWSLLVDLRTMFLTLFQRQNAC